jgi:hypothetical protein
MSGWIASRASDVNQGNQLLSSELAKVVPVSTEYKRLFGEPPKRDVERSPEMVGESPNI